MKNENQRHVESIAEELKKVYNGEVENEDGEIVSFWEYFVGEEADDVYDVEYTIGSNKEYRGVRLMVACGGPNIYIDTRAGEVQLYWWTDKATAWIPREVCDAIDEVWEELYNC